GVALGLSAALILYLDLAALGWPAALARDPLLGAQVLAVALASSILLVRTASGEAASPRRRRWWELLGAVIAVGSVPAAFYAAVVATRVGASPLPLRPGRLMIPLEAPAA